MGMWNDAQEAWEKGRAFVDKLTDAKEKVEAAGDTVKAARDAKARAGNGVLYLNADQAYYAMTLKYGSKYWVDSASRMSSHDIEEAQRELVESWKAFRRLTLITNAVQWAFNKMLGGSPPVPDFKDILNALQALFEATGDNPTRAEVMEFWRKFNSDQLSVSEQVARGLTNTGVGYRGILNRSEREQLSELMREP